MNPNQNILKTEASYFRFQNRLFAIDGSLATNGQEIWFDRKNGVNYFKFNIKDVEKFSVWRSNIYLRIAKKNYTIELSSLQNIQGAFNQVETQFLGSVNVAPQGGGGGLATTNMTTKSLDPLTQLTDSEKPKLEQWSNILAVYGILSDPKYGKKRFRHYIYQVLIITLIVMTVIPAIIIFILNLISPMPDFVN